MTLIKFIGDVHGKYGRYETILKNSDLPTIQVGDMGVGFFHRDYEGTLRPFANPPYDKMVAGNHRFIRGNHDNPYVCRQHTQFIPDGTVENDVMFVGGGLSIDRDFRVLNETYWADEELSIEELYNITDKYLEVKPRIMITHEAPEIVTDHMFNKMKINDPSRTRQAFQSMWEQHKPELWIFGHWHDHRDMNILGTRFICLNELQTCDVDLESLTVIYDGNENSHV